MRILAFYPYLPHPLDRGAYYRGFYLLRALANRHEVDLIALTENGDGLGYEHVFAEFCRRVQLVPFQHPPWERLFPKRLGNPLPSTVAHWTLPPAQAALEQALASHEFDAVHIFDIILAQYFLQGTARSLPLVADRTRVDLQYQLMERQRMRFSLKTRLLNLENLLKLWRYERRVARRTRVQVVCGPDDETFVRQHISHSVNLAVIPNGVDTGYFRAEAAPGEVRSAKPSVLFCGAMDYSPNVDALRWYFGEIHDALIKRVPELLVWIVGKDPVPEVKACGRRPNVTVTGAVPDVRPYYRRAWLQIVPLRIGGGTRLKIVECMAMGTPVVSTTIGAQGLHLQHGQNILLADTASEFVEQTASALKSSALRQSLEAAGLETVRARLSWPMLGQQLCDVYAQCFPSRGGKQLARPVGPATDSTKSALFLPVEKL